MIDIGLKIIKAQKESEEAQILGHKVNRMTDDLWAKNVEHIGHGDE